MSWLREGEGFGGVAQRRGAILGGGSEEERGFGV